MKNTLLPMLGCISPIIAIIAVEPLGDTWARLPMCLLSGVVGAIIIIIGQVLGRD